MKHNLRIDIMEYLANTRCQLCGWDMINPFSGMPTLHVHHKDGNSTNHKKENIIVICPNCHSLTETYCGLNNKKALSPVGENGIRTALKMPSSLLEVRVFHGGQSSRVE